MNQAIVTRMLSKSFQGKVSRGGFKEAFTSLFSEKKELFSAVKDFCFSVNKGEKVALIGPNGAGKSTTLKMLTGILTPSSGTATVLGLVPWENRKQLGFHIGTVFGQRSQLWYHLPAIDSFNLLAAIYEIDEESYQKQKDFLCDLFEIQKWIYRPLKSLSLGQRMRCEIVGSLLHRPELLFLDEPTVGLDINAKLKLRTLINQICKENGTTLVLTSHDSADIENICDRVVVLNQGVVIRDSSLEAFRKNQIKRKRVTFITDVENLEMTLNGLFCIERGSYKYVCEIDLQQLSLEKVIHEVLIKANIKDLVIEEPSMDQLIHQLYQEKAMRS